MNFDLRRRSATALGIILLSITLLSCTSDSDDTSIGINNGEVQVLPVPHIIRTTRDIASAQIQLEISLDGQVIRTVPTASADSVETAVQVPINQAVDLVLSWYAIVQNNKVLLADSTTTLPAAEGDSTITINSYLSSGDSRFDVDGDQRTNISEIRDNRNPLSAIDYQVPFFTGNFMPANLTITNDGIDGNTSGDPIEPDEDSQFSVWHDGNSLNLYLCGKDATLSESSDQYWHDDTVFVFLDGSNNDSTVYDGIDDYQIAFIRSTEEMVVSKGSTNAGCLAGDCITFDFFNNSSSCQYEMTAQFPLANMNISTDPTATFGFDIEFTDDDNGGLREDAAAWIGFDDRSDIDPSTFGTMQLLP